MARIVDGPEITGQVTHKQTGQSYGPVTVTVSPKVYTDREMTASVTSLTTDGTGVFSCYAPPGTYTFTTAAVDAATIESVEVLGHEAGTGTPQSAAYGGFSRPEAFGAVGDGITDDTAAFTALVAANPTLVRLTPGKNYLIAPDVFQLGNGCVLDGQSGGSYPVLDTGDGAKVAKLTIKSIASFDCTTDANYNTATPAHWGVKVGSKAVVRNVSIIAANVAATVYSAANYPGAGNTTGIGSITPTNSATTGLVCGPEATTDGVIAQGFRVGIYHGTTGRIDRCFVSMCDYGYYLGGSDGWMTESVAMFCYTRGVYAGANYWRYTANRFEWNARIGLDSAGESTIVGNLFDRNGWAGLNLRSGAWGQVVTGNYFSRNGVGGNGTTGRWGFTTPTDASYVATTSAQSCHITIDAQRAVVLTGNRYRAGPDDSAGGVNGPAFIYSSGSTDGATGGSLTLGNNAGEFGSDGLGYDPGGASYASVTGAVAGGSDTTMATDLNALVANKAAGIVTASRLTTTRPFAAQSTTVTVPVPIGATAGRILLAGTAFGTMTLSTVYFAQGNSSAYQTAFVNHIGTAVTSVAFSSGSVVITATSLFYNYTLETAC